MKIQIKTNDNMKGSAELEQQTEVVVEHALGRLVEHVTRVEVHPSDENGKKNGGRDKRCVMEARLEGHQPIAVTYEAETMDQAVDGAARALKSSLDHTLGQLRERQGQNP